MLRGPFAALSDRTLLGLTEAHRGLVTDLERWDVLERRGLVEEEDRPSLERVRAALRALRRTAERLGPARTLREAVRELEVEQTLLLLPRGVQRIANVRKLLRIAEEEPTIRALLERVARAEERAREPEAATFSDDDDAVRLVTMHASKGLAFRVVILPELRGSPVRSPNTTLGIDLRADPARLATKVLDDRGEPAAVPSLVRLAERDRARLRADRRRLMYVAVTRARERIVFVGGIKNGARSEPSFGAVLQSFGGSAHVDLREVPIEAPTKPLVRAERPGGRPHAAAPRAHGRGRDRPDRAAGFPSLRSALRARAPRLAPGADPDRARPLSDRRFACDERARRGRGAPPRARAHRHELVRRRRRSRSRARRARGLRRGTRARGRVARASAPRPASSRATTRARFATRAQRRGANAPSC